MYPYPINICMVVLDTLEAMESRHIRSILMPLYKPGKAVSAAGAQGAAVFRSFSSCKGVQFIQKKQHLTPQALSRNEINSYLDLVPCLLLVSQAASSVSH